MKKHFLSPNNKHYEKNFMSIIKVVQYYTNFEGRRNFTGIVKDYYGNTAHYVNGSLTREDDAAIECFNGQAFYYYRNQYYGDDLCFTKETWKEKIEKKVL